MANHDKGGAPSSISLPIEGASLLSNSLHTILFFSSFNDSICNCICNCINIVFNCIKFLYVLYFVCIVTW